MVNHWLTSGWESDVEIYRVNHHGSRNSLTIDLAAGLEPEVVIYSCGGKYNHPSRDIAERFLEAEADQIVTSSVDSEEWSNGVFPEVYDRGWESPVGDLFIFVPLAGDSYVMATQNQAFEYLAYSDDEEAEGLKAGEVVVFENGVVVSELSGLEAEIDQKLAVD